MIWVSQKKSRAAAIREAKKHNLMAAHCYYIGNYIADEEFGKNNWLVADKAEGNSAKSTYQIYGLWWWKLRGRIVNKATAGVTAQPQD